MKPRHLVAATIIAAVGIAAALDARTPPPPTAAESPGCAARQAVPRKYWLLTPVTLDAMGRVATAGTPEVLDSTAAYRLADMLAVEEAREAAGVDRAGEAAGTGQNRRCAAVAASTGQQCRKYARPGSAYCEIHDPNAR
jgi:hypothetical protein